MAVVRNNLVGRRWRRTNRLLPRLRTGGALAHLRRWPDVARRLDPAVRNVIPHFPTGTCQLGGGAVAAGDNGIRCGLSMADEPNQAAFLDWHLAIPSGASWYQLEGLIIMRWRRPVDQVFASSTRSTPGRRRPKRRRENPDDVLPQRDLLIAPLSGRERYTRVMRAVMACGCWWWRMRNSWLRR